MNIITNRPIIDRNNLSSVQEVDSSEDFYSLKGDYSNCSGCSGIDGDYSNLDASSPTNEIQRFQAWMNAEHQIPLKGGTWDMDTALTYQSYGKNYELEYNKDFDKKNAEFDSGKSKAYTKGGKGGGTFKDIVATSKKLVKEAIEKEVKDKKEKEKKGMSTTTKVLIGVGIALVLGTTIYFVAKK